MKNTTAIILIIITISACKTTGIVTMSVIEPAPVSLHSDIKNVGIINRSIASEKTERINKVDQILSVEGADLDKDGAAESILGVRDQLTKNNRFAEVKFLEDVDLRSTGLGVFPSPLAWETVEKICQEHHLDVIFALELFDTDSKINYTTTPVSVKGPFGVDIPAVEHHARMLTSVNTGWRIYDPISKNILDEHAISKSLTFSGRGINPVVAAAGLVGRKDAVNQTGYKVGQGYALRIIPYKIRVSRDYYTNGSDNFKRAKRKAQTGNWNAAAQLWEMETSNPKSKLAGRGCYNMAIINEINGDLDMAIQWAQKAYEDYNDRLGLRYVKILNRRMARNNKLLRQQEQ